MKLVWNEVEEGWICSNCGAIYGTDEVNRVFGFDEQSPDRFYESYCMDCGCLWENAEKDN